MPGRFIADECEKHGVLLFNFVPNTVTIAPPLKITRDELAFALDDSGSPSADHPILGLGAAGNL